MKKSDFSYEVLKKGPYGGYTCRISYKGVWVYGFGTCPDGVLSRKGRRRDNSMHENVEVIINGIMNGLYPSVTNIIKEKKL